MPAKATAKKATTEPVATEPVATEPVVAEPAAAEPAYENSEAAYEHVMNLMNKYDASLREMRLLGAEVRKTMRMYAKLSSAETKAAGKGKKKKREVDPDAPPRAPSGFAKPARLSAELAKFLGVSKDTEVARTDVTKQITAYVKANELQDPANKRIILCDPALQKLLNPPPGAEVTFFTLQTHLKHHFVKADGSKSAAAATTSAAVAPAEKKVAVKKKAAPKKAAVATASA